MQKWCLLGVAGTAGRRCLCFWERSLTSAAGGVTCNIILTLGAAARSWRWGEGWAGGGSALGAALKAPVPTHPQACWVPAAGSPARRWWGENTKPREYLDDLSCVDFGLNCVRRSLACFNSAENQCGIGIPRLLAYKEAIRRFAGLVGIVLLGWFFF